MTTVLGIETSCDETAAAIVRRTGGASTGEILSNTVYSQISDHAAYGGVVPEIAARAHVEGLDAIIRRTLDEAEISFADIDAVAVTAGPGLIGGLLVGTMTAKAISAARGIPLVAVNHLEGHALTPRLTDGIGFPYLLLLVSGGHTQILLVRGARRLQPLGHDHRRRAGRGLRQDCQAARPALSRRAGGREGGCIGRSNALCLSAPDEGRGAARFLLFRAEDGRPPTGNGIGAANRHATSPTSAPRSRPPSPRRLPTGSPVPCAATAPRSPRDRPIWSLPAASPPTGRSALRSTACVADRQRLHAQRAAAAALFRQCGDDRLGRAGTFRGGRDKRHGFRAAFALAARQRRRGADRRRAPGSQGVSADVAVIGAGAWGTALAAATARAAGSCTAVGPRCCGRRGDQPHAPQSALSRRHRPAGGNRGDRRSRTSARRRGNRAARRSRADHAVSCRHTLAAGSPDSGSGLRLLRQGHRPRDKPCR